jgi:hypothetical protein
MLLKSGVAAKALQLPSAAEACKNHLRETFRSFDTKGIKLSLLQGEVKLAAARKIRQGDSTAGRES